MTQEQIEQAAKGYAKKCYEEWGFHYDETVASFLAGAESRQAEIEELTADAKRYKNDVAEGLQREEIAKKIIEDKRAEIEQLLKNHSK